MEAPTSNVARNTFINVAGAIAPLVLSLATIPPYLHAIGEDRYGVLAVVWVLFGYFGVFEFGLSRAAANQIAKMKAASAEEREQLFWTAVALNVAIGVFGGLALLLVGNLLLSHVIDVSPGLRSEALKGLPWLALAVPGATLTLVLTGTLEGLERFLTVNVLAFAGLAIYQLAPLGYAYWVGPSLDGLIMVTSFSLLAGTVMLLVAAVRYLPVTRRPAIDRGRIRELFTYGGWITISNVLTPLLSVADRIFIGATLGARSVTRYTIPFLLVSRTLIFSTSLARTLFPRFSMLPEREAANVGREALRANVASMTPIAVIGIVAVEPFLELWAGRSISRGGGAVAEILLLGMWVQSVATVPYTFLQAQGRPNLTARFHLLEVIPYLAGLLLGLHFLGIEGAAWAWSGRLAMDGALLFWATRHAFAISGAGQNWREVLSSGALVLL